MSFDFGLDEFLISIDLNKETYYLVDVEIQTNVAKWTLRKKDAYIFPTREDVNSFVETYLCNRKDVKIQKI